MESKIIKSFFDGTFSDEMIKTPRTKEYKDIDKRETELYDKLRPQLTAEQVKLFDEFVDLYGERHALEEEAYYIRGFKFGVHLVIECFDFSDVDTKQLKTFTAADFLRRSPLLNIIKFFTYVIYCINNFCPLPHMGL